MISDISDAISTKHSNAYYAHTSSMIIIVVFFLNKIFMRGNSKGILFFLANYVCVKWICMKNGSCLEVV